MLKGGTDCVADERVVDLSADVCGADDVRPAKLGELVTRRAVGLFDVCRDSIHRLWIFPFHEERAYSASRVSRECLEWVPLN